MKTIKYYDASSDEVSNVLKRLGIRNPQEIILGPAETLTELIRAYPETKYVLRRLTLSWPIIQEWKDYFFTTFKREVMKPEYGWAMGFPKYEELCAKWLSNREELDFSRVKTKDLHTILRAWAQMLCAEGFYIRRAHGFIEMS